MIRRSLATLLVCLVGAGSLVALAAAPASAAPCPRGTGVTVVVDGNQLGGLSTTCVPGGGRSATSAFSAAGVAMTYAARQQGFVCRVNGAPANAGCVNASPANAYWSLWTSSGNGAWSYASTGVAGASIPAGGWVAWSWQGQSARSAPSVSPQGPAPAPSPTSKPVGGGTSSGGSSPGSAPKKADPAKKSTPEGSARAQAARKQQAQEEAAVQEKQEAARKKAAADTSPSTPASSADSSTSDGDTRATSADAGSPWPTLVGVAAVLVLLGAAGIVAWRRRGSAP